jgi:hypothetical protein
MWARHILRPPLRLAGFSLATLPIPLCRYTLALPLLMHASGWKLSLLILLCGALMATALAHEPGTAIPTAPSTTREHLKHAPWWPTMQVADESQFTGEQECAGCHAGIARTQITTQMARTLMPAASSQILATHTGPIFKFGSWRYQIVRAKDSFVLTVGDGNHQRSEPLQWAFGSGAIAQSYLWWEKGQLYESRFNYFADLHGFDRTPGRLAAPPVSLDMAQGRQLADFEARQCYSCHTTALTTSQPLTAAHYQPGITCEACHGPGRAHVEAMNKGEEDDMHIVNPATLAPAVSVDFCGACHSTPKDAELMGMVGPVTARFPAYRLEKSRCWGATGDAGLTCFACHDPHRPLERDPAAYDNACLRCHANGPSGRSRTAAVHAACPVAKSRCTSCHMEKIRMAGIHYDFTDHEIRIVKPGAPFPD